MNAKIEAETDDAKKKEYYASAEYTRLEKKKKRIGAARQKTKVVSTNPWVPKVASIVGFVKNWTHF